MVRFKQLLGSPLKLTVTLLVVSALIIFGLEATNTTHIFHKKKVNYGSGVIPSDKATESTNTINGQLSSNDSAPASDKTGQAGVVAPSNGLTAPSGTFVSNHRPNLSGSPRPSKVESQCVVQPGATCYIEFSKDGVTKRLEEQAAGTSGAIYWNWDIKEAGLTQGSWKITAVAKNGDLTERTSDSVALEVQP